MSELTVVASLCGISALAGYLLYRWRVAFWVAAAGAVALTLHAWGKWTLPGIAPAQGGLSRSLAMSFGMGAIVFALGGLSVRKPSLLPALGMVTLGLVAAAFLVNSGVGRALLFGGAVLLAALCAGEGPPERAEGPATLMLLGLVPIGMWVLTEMGLAPKGAGHLIALSALPLLGFVPFHSWAVTSFRDNSPLGTAFAVAILRLGVVAWLGLSGATGYIPSGALGRILIILGIFSLLWAGVRGFASRTFGELGGYLAAAQGGVMLLLYLGGTAISDILVYGVLSGTSLTALATGRELLIRARKENRGYPLATWVLLAGVLAAGGMPLTPGFQGQLLAVGRLSGLGKTLATALVLGSGAGLFLGGMNLLKPYSRALRFDEELLEPSAALLLALLVGIFLGIRG